MGWLGSRCHGVLISQLAQGRGKVFRGCSAQEEGRRYLQVIGKGMEQIIGRLKKPFLMLS